MIIMLTRLGGVISMDGDNEKCEDKWRHNDVCMENPDRNCGFSGWKDGLYGSGLKPSAVLSFKVSQGVKI